jgi:hypothetical protein
MKKQLSLSLVVLMLSCTFSFCSAQKSNHTITSEGYWVVESNTKTPKISVIYFYNIDNVLVYKENVDGIKIKVSRKKVISRLNNVLEQSLIAWKQDHIAGENRMLVSLSLQK